MDTIEGKEMVPARYRDFAAGASALCCAPAASCGEATVSSSSKLCS